MKNPNHSKLALRGALIASLAMAGHAVSACGSNGDSNNAPPSYGTPDGGYYASGGFTGATGGITGATGGSGGGVASGGSGGATGGSGGTSSGGTGSGGTSSGGASSGGTTGDAAACVVPDKLLDTSTLTACDSTKFPLCTNGKCFATSAVPEASRDQLADCSATQKCVPTYFIERVAKFIAPTCKSLNDAEGRCLSKCIPQIAEQATFLPQSTCDDGDLCAPCYDPRTGADTGACTQGCDTGPSEPKVVFDKCCGGIGSCVPKDVVPTADQALLDAGSCTGADQLCAPDKLSDSTYVPKACRSLGDTEGRCLAACIPQIAAQADRLPQADCDTGELCAPCYDPIQGTDTGACTRNGDTPKEDKKVFPTCCNDLGHCVPDSILSTDQKALLSKDTCSGTGDLCAPDVFSGTGDPPQVCRALSKLGLNAEGRCIPTCVPSVSSQADRLDQGTAGALCPDNTLCAPCYDPLTGEDTGACSQAPDSPKEAKVVFPACCDGIGSCVPTSAVTPAQLSQLGTDTCTGTDIICAPKSLATPGAKPVTCRAPGDYEGRCLPTCLPPIQDQLANLRQQTCNTGEVCANCYNPIDGVDTGACTINGDAPVEAKKTFDMKTCGLAGGTTPRGWCVPKTLIPTNLQPMLPVDTCTGADSPLCAPIEKVKDQSYKFVSCTPQIPPFPPDPNQPAACVPKYIIDFKGGTAALLGQSDCTTGYICAPCKDPTTGLNTGSCD